MPANLGNSAVATLYTQYINQYTAKDTVGKEYGDLAANIGPTSEKPFPESGSSSSGLGTGGSATSCPTPGDRLAEGCQGGRGERDSVCGPGLTADLGILKLM